MEKVRVQAALSNGSEAVFPVLLSLSFAHLLNDAMQSLIPSIYPLIKKNYHLDFSQIGLITLTYQLTASLLQPLVGHFTDRHPQPYSLATGMCFTLCGLISLSMAGSFHAILLSVALVGMGSSVFHPESSRMARLASGGKHGTAQSLFQVGGNTGAAIGPLLAAAIVVPFGQRYLLWFCVLACVGIVVLWRVGRWYQTHHLATHAPHKKTQQTTPSALTRMQIGFSLFILLLLIFSKYFYLASMNNYLTFYLMAKFHISIQHAQVYLFIFLFAVAAGTMIGGPVGDRIGRKYVIWISILGVAPFTLLLPYANLFWTAILCMLIGFILSSAFSAIIVYAQELLPGKVGMISGLFFGLAFGMGGIGSAVLGELADRTSIFHVYHVCSFLPLIGLLAGFLPDIEKHIRTS
ncbi:MFS transporter [Thermoflavifilum thermophilum]|uniref:MFS transporter, FSR family, fosmidomycin resistance protein n=1 Tax=Thermoflavifilum thermophilum TaxID=1393122 RepID=A0A1I7NMA8_9BACT|nr:MFS transporter [Thermoflavifilum thermophilum]SFV35803.1 MFS transporter, FSR family, fosmidomycin resistance protein [Thermoflavifilum thermophilum]